jgi:hypothetical protein
MSLPAVSAIATELRCRKMAGSKIHYVAVALDPAIVADIGAITDDRRVRRITDTLFVCGLTVVSAAGESGRLIPGWNK